MEKKLPNLKLHNDYEIISDKKKVAAAAKKISREFTKLLQELEIDGNNIVNERNRHLTQTQRKIALDAEYIWRQIAQDAKEPDYDVILIKNSKGVQAAATYSTKIYKNSIYIELIATAPQNLSGFENANTTKRQSAKLIAEIIKKEKNDKNEGKVKLSSLDYSAPFYKHIGFEEDGDSGQYVLYPDNANSLIEKYGYKKGGYTGKGNPNEIAEVVHKEEYVLSSVILKPVMKVTENIKESIKTIEQSTIEREKKIADLVHGQDRLKKIGKYLASDKFNTILKDLILGNAVPVATGILARVNASSFGKGAFSISPAADFILQQIVGNFDIGDNIILNNTNRAIIETIMYNKKAFIDPYLRGEFTKKTAIKPIKKLVGTPKYYKRLTKSKVNKLLSAIPTQTILSYVSKRPKLSTFAVGGFTGFGNESEFAGLVHRNEFVVPKKEVDKAKLILPELPRGSVINVITAKEIVKQLIAREQKIAELIYNERYKPQEDDDIIDFFNNPDPIKSKFLDNWIIWGGLKDSKRIKGYEKLVIQNSRGTQAAAGYYPKKDSLYLDLLATAIQNLEGFKNIRTTRGMGGAALAAVVKRKREFGLKNVQLHSLADARPFYEKMGMTSEDNSFYTLPPENEDYILNKYGQNLNNVGFKRGGYTGQGNPNQRAGYVHKGEYVFTKQEVDAIGLQNIINFKRRALRNSKSVYSKVFSKNNNVNRFVNNVKQETQNILENVLLYFALKFVALNKDAAELISKTFSLLFKFVDAVSTFGIDALLTGMSKVVGGGSLLEKIGGAFQAFLGYKSIKYLMNPFSLFKDIKYIVDLTRKIVNVYSKGGARAVAFSAGSLLGNAYRVAKSKIQGITKGLTNNRFTRGVSKVGKFVNSTPIGKQVISSVGSFIKGAAKNNIVKGVGSVLKTVGRVPFISSLIDFGVNLATGDSVQRAGTKAVFSGAGTFAGGKAGAAIGATIGSVVPGLGTAVGAVVGGIVGSIGGFFAGDYVGTGVADVAKFAKGGLVTKETNAIIGEAGPELVVPIKKLNNLINNDIQLIPYLLGGMKSYVASQGSLRYKIDRYSDSLLNKYISEYGISKLTPIQSLNINKTNIEEDLQKTNIQSKFSVNSIIPNIESIGKNVENNNNNNNRVIVKNNTNNDFIGGNNSTDIPPEGRALLDAIANSESAIPNSDNGYRARYPSKTFDSFKDHPRIAERILSGPNAGNVSDAAGRYQFISTTWDSLAKRLNLKDFSPENQDKAAWQLAIDVYGKGKQGIIQSLRKNPLSVARKLAPTWTSLPGGIEENAATRDFERKFRKSVSKYRSQVKPELQPQSKSNSTKLSTKKSNTYSEMKETAQSNKMQDMTMPVINNKISPTLLNNKKQSTLINYMIPKNKPTFNYSNLVKI